MPRRNPVSLEDARLKDTSRLDFYARKAWRVERKSKDSGGGWGRLWFDFPFPFPFDGLAEDSS